MALDSRPTMQQSFYSQIPGVGIQFTNPFPSQTTTTSAGLLPSSLASDCTFARHSIPTSNSQSYSLSGTSSLTDRINPSYFATDMFTQGTDKVYANSYATDHSMPESSSASPTASSFPVTSLAGTVFDFATNPLNKISYLANESRRMSTPTVSSSTFLGTPVEVTRQRQNSMIDWRGMHTQPAYSHLRHENFNDTIDSARGMLAMSQSGHRHQRMRQDTQHGYYSSNHSANSSISSTGSYNHGYYGSMDSSATEMSNGDDCSRTLPRPNAYISSNAPHAAQAMMSSFSSKITSSTQKKHRCKICDKRFTRPSSLLTHTYSHTGEKPFKCEVEGCGRNFSVVSNLRRHKKVHRNQQSVN